MNGAVPVWEKNAGEFFKSGKYYCPDCGVELPPADTDAEFRKAHYAVCTGKRVDGSALTTTESDELHACEQIIERGIKIWQEVGEALLHIRDKRLYRATHKTFEDYCRDRWQMASSRARQLIAASEVYQNLSDTTGNTLLSNERQARELVPFAPDEQRLLIQVASELYPDGKPSAADLKSLGIVLKEITATGAIDDGTGNQIPVANATTEHLKFAVIEETYERAQRQQAHITANAKRKTKLLHNVEFDAMSEFDLANLSLMMKCQMVGKHLQIIIREVEE